LIAVPYAEASDTNVYPDVGGLGSEPLDFWPRVAQSASEGNHLSRPEP